MAMQDFAERRYSESSVRVRYAETDQMGVVYHANYLVWFEIGRVDFMRSAGLNYAAMERENNAMIAVVDVHARYKAPARYDDELSVRTRLASVRGSMLRFAYTIVRSSDAAVLCEGETVHIVVDRTMNRCALPERYAELFKSLTKDAE